MKEIAEQFFKEHEGEDIVIITEDGQPFLDKDAAQNWADRNDFADPETFYREGTEPEDPKELAEQLAISQEENQDLVLVLDQIENALDFSKECPEVDQKTNSLVAQIVCIRDQSKEKEAFLGKIKEALFAPELVSNEAGEELIEGILNLRLSLQTANEAKKQLEESLAAKQTEIDGLKTNSIEVKNEKVVEPAAKEALKNSK